METQHHHLHANLCPECGEPLVAVPFFWSRRGFAQTLANTGATKFPEASVRQPCSCSSCGFLGIAAGQVLATDDQPDDLFLW